MTKWDGQPIAKDQPEVEAPEEQVNIVEEADPLQVLQEQVKQLETDNQKNYDLYLRALAEVDNMKKRGQREREEYMRYGHERLLKKLLTVMDDLERALAGCERSEDLSSLNRGVELIAKNLEEILKNEGLNTVEAKNCEFDPQIHQALTVEPHPELAANMVIEELQKGYFLHDRLIRPSLVRVSE